VCAAGTSYSVVLVDGSASRSAVLQDEAAHAFVMTDNRTRPEEYALDHAKVRLVNLTSFEPAPLVVTGISENCYKCLKLPLSEFVDDSETQPNTYSLDTTFPFNFMFQQAIPFTYHFGDRGVYTMLVKKTTPQNSTSAESISILVVEDREPINIWIPIGVAIAIYATVAIGWGIANIVYKKRQESALRQQAASEPLLANGGAAAKEVLLCSYTWLVAHTHIVSSMWRCNNDVNDSICYVREMHEHLDHELKV
jgi:hypothetical protein